MKKKQKQPKCARFFKVSIFASYLSIVIGFIGLAGANSAIQEAAIMSMVIALCIVPYCLAKASRELAIIELEEKEKQNADD